MGWTYIHATHYYSSGTVNRKKECDEIIDLEYHRILKSKMVGSTWYGAIQILETNEVIGTVILTHSHKKGYYNFGYKLMTEGVGPCYYDCPASILELLTPTENDLSNNWRKECTKRSGETSLQSLPIGTRISYSDNGKHYLLQKMPPAYQFKTAWWYVVSEGTYVPKTRIPRTFKVVS